MSNILRRLFKNEYVLLSFFLLKLWLTVFHLNRHYNVYYKYKYIKPNDDEFLQKYKNYYNSSLIAFKHMQQWLKFNSAYRNDQSGLLFNRNNVSLCVGVLSQKRFSDRVNYPFQTVVALLTRIQLKYQEKVRIDVLNVDDMPNSRSDLKDLIGVVNIVELKQNLSFKIDKNTTPKLKEAADYVFAMQYYSNSHPWCEYILLLEDDSMSSPNWYDKVSQSIQFASNQTNNWFCLKLFTSFRSFDWLIHLRTVLWTLCVVAVMTLVLLQMFYFILYLKYRYILKIPRPMIKKSRIVISLFIINSLAILILFNSTSLSPLGYGLKSFAIGFNTVANVYPRSKLTIISSYIEANIESYLSGRQEKFQPKDLSLNGFRSSSGLKEFIFEPAIFQHVGLQSSLGGYAKWEGIFKLQYRPFQSYSFEKEYSSANIQFDPQFWVS